MSDHLTDEKVAAEFGRLTGERPDIRPEVADLLARYKPEADHYKAHGPYVPQPNPVPVTQPIPGWMKGVALMSPPAGGGVWLATQGVEGVMNAVTPEVLGALGLGGVLVLLLGRSLARRGPKKVVTNNDYRGSTITNRNSSGFNYKSHNG